MTEPLRTPSAIVFAVCERAQRNADGTFNLTSVTTNVVLEAAGSPLVPVAVIWTDGLGVFEQTVRVLDADGHQVSAVSREFSLTNTGELVFAGVRARLRHEPGAYTLILERGGAELARQQVTVALRPGAGRR